MEKTSPQSLSSRETVQQKALTIAKKHDRCGLAISMGVGKTYIGLMHMDWYLKELDPDAKFLIVAPKKSIFNSWFDDMYKFGLQHLQDRLTITTYLSLGKQHLNYNVVYLDECHSLLYSHDLWLNSYTGKIIGLTGTPPRFKRSEKGEMVDRYCPIMYSYITDSAVDDRILNDYRIVVHTVNLSRLATHQVNLKEKSFMTSEYENYKYWCTRIHNARNPKDDQFTRIARMKAIMEYRSKEMYAEKLLKDIEGKCIIFCNTHEQAERMCEHVYHSGNADSDQNLEMFKDGTITRLSCVLQLNEGINIPDLGNAIILHAYGNERKTAQRLGRVLRLSPDQLATVHILMYRETVDESWVKKSLQDFDPDKITYKDVYDNRVHS